jgi:hypothetical protein
MMRINLLDMDLYIPLSLLIELAGLVGVAVLLWFAARERQD